MNKLSAVIVKIESDEHISLVDLKANGDIFSCIIIETPQTASYLKIGLEVFILFKETEVALAKNFSGQISMRNHIKAIITRIKTSGILSEIILDYKGLQIISIITTGSVQRLKLNPGESIDAFIKANEVSLMEKD